MLFFFREKIIIFSKKNWTTITNDYISKNRLILLKIVFDKNSIAANFIWKLEDFWMEV